MSVMFYENSPNEIGPVTATEWTEVATKSGNLNATDNFIFVSCEYSGTLTNRNVGIRVLVDGVEAGFDHFVPTIADQYRKYSDFGMLGLAEPGSHTISLEARILGAGQSMMVRRIRLMVMQV